MKAILVIDMPMDCYDCPFHRSYLDRQMNEEIFCSPMKKDIDGFNAKAEWCPLKPLPSTRNDDMEERGFNIGMFNYGWNECIKEIEK